MSAARITVRRGGWSLRIAPWPVTLICGLLVALSAVLVASVALGEFNLPVADVVASIVGAGDASTDFIVLDLRLPRALTAILAGAALGMSGAVFQEVTRNPLVSPDIVGVSGGAAVAACSLIVLGKADAPVAVPLAALGGALVAGAVLYGLAWRDGIDGYRVVLVGIGLGAFTTAAIGYVLTRGRIFEVAEAYLWMVGTVNGRSWSQVVPLAVSLLVLVPLLLALARRMDALTLGDDVARSFGMHVERTRSGLLLIAVVLVAVAVAAAGPVGFVAFIAPHLARRLLGAGSAQALVPLAGLAGALLVLGCDLGARLVFSPTEVPVGLITSIVAAPYFLLLLRRAGRIGAAG